MKQKDKAQKLNGAEGFDKYYSALFGERWTNLKQSLQLEVNHCEYKAGGKESYFLDSASIRAAVSLPLKGAHSILDMCAAPGGKTLVIASVMDDSSTILANERSPDRKLRLVHTIQNCLDIKKQEQITVICKDGATLCKSKNNVFDRILLDAPCSSERHVLNDENYLKDWSPSRIRTLCVAQWSLLSSAWRMLKEGGYMIYSTCALNNDENDNMIKKLIKKFNDVQVCSPEINLDVSNFCDVKFPQGEKTAYAVQILPDKSNGAGPLYFCLLKKVSIPH